MYVHIHSSEIEQIINNRKKGDILDAADILILNADGHIHTHTRSYLQYFALHLHTLLSTDSFGDFYT